MKELLKKTITKFNPRIKGIKFLFEDLDDESTEENLVIVTTAKDSGKHGNVFGYSRTAKEGIYHICLFEKNIKKLIIDNSKIDTDEGVGVVFLHEAIHVLDKIKNGRDTLSEKEITKLAHIYYKNKSLPIVL